MDAQTIRTIEAILACGERVELMKGPGGEVKVLRIRRETVPVEKGLWKRGSSMTEKEINAITAALAQGHRVQLKQLKDGTIKIQIVFQKELKVS